MNTYMDGHGLYGTTRRPMEMFDPWAVALKTASLFSVTGFVVTGKVAELLPSGMTTLAGAVATSGFCAVSVTVRPPGGRGVLGEPLYDWRRLARS